MRYVPTRRRAEGIVKMTDKSILVREASFQDESQIRSILDEAISGSLDAAVHNIVSIRQNVHENVDLWLTKRVEILHLVAEQAGELVGVLLIKDFQVLCSLFVRPTFQRKGIGSALVRHALHTCKEKSPCTVLRLFANNDAIAFYEALGFEVKALKKPAPAGSTAMFFNKDFQKSRADSLREFP